MQQSPDTILFIHGLWLTPRSWEHFAERYGSRGYKVLAPGWPGTEGEVEALRRDPSLLDGLDLKQVVDHYDRIIRGLDSPPILIGHSLGGTITQLLLDRGLGAAAVGLAPATVKGIRDLPLSTLRASSAVLRNPFRRGKGIPYSKKQFKYGMANTLDRETSDRLWERYAVPAGSGVLFDVALANLTRNSPATVSFRNDARAPMLFVAFERDHVVPPKPIRHNVERYSESAAITEFREFPGRPHFPGAPGWEEVADLALSWAVERAAAPRPVAVAS
ncbi:MAG TPA: alpha/beta hydrolase [Gaiellaceae bacterium]|jgi:pimeloyl-ACP methyl ester carboxylesterase|nr:alpha/beta hydrolase [Gaiellaceae bacterium]HEX2495502.1 alpha/beta hydrolase [Gaiellaceae bacterium]